MCCAGAPCLRRPTLARFADEQMTSDAVSLNNKRIDLSTTSGEEPRIRLILSRCALCIPARQPKKDTSLAALVAFREDCAGNKAAIEGVVMHRVDTVFPVFGARFNRSVTAQLALVMLPLAF